MRVGGEGENEGGKEGKEASEGHGEGERKRREVRSIGLMKEKRGSEEREEGKPEEYWIDEGDEGR